MKHHDFIFEALKKCFISCVIFRTTKSQLIQKFSAFSEVFETPINQIACSYHEGIPSYYVKKSQNLLLSQLFLEHSFFVFIDILFRL